MKIIYSPQRNDEILQYGFNGEEIHVIHMKPTGEVDEVGNPTYDLIGEETFDFSQMPDGIMEEIETTLPINPIVSARRENGVLHVVLLNFIGDNATEEEKFPQEIEV